MPEPAAGSVGLAPPSGPNEAASGSGRGTARALGRAGLALAGGLSTALAFPPIGLAPLAIVGPALLWIALRERGALPRALLGLAFGVGFFGALLSWVERAGVHAWVALTLGEALFVVLFSLAAGPFVRGSRPIPSAVGWAGLWGVVMEALRARVPLGGFPWGTLGGPFAGTPVGALGPFIGGLGVAVLLAFAAALLGWAALGRWRAAALGLAGASLLVAASTFVGPGPPAGPALRVAVVQPSVPLPVAPDSRERAGRVLADAVALTRSIQPGRFDLVVWPEGTVELDGPRPGPGQPAPEPLFGLARSLRTEIMVGVVSEAGPGLFRNSALAVSPSGKVIGVYDKERPVPFGEYVPGRRFLGFVTALQAIPEDMVPGRGPRTLPVPGGMIGTPISYETGFARIVREFVRSGAGAIVVPTNTSSFGTRSGAAEQELELTRMRAIELDRWVVQASSAGISAIIGPTGRVIERTGLYERRIAQGEIRMGASLTPFARWGETPVIVASLGLLALGLLLVRGGLRPGRRAIRE